uniref:Cytochrome c n=1 Tax=Acidobacterium capsulatum TaxID=33075 RepID=A0A7V4XS93_9BACT
MANGRAGFWRGVLWVILLEVLAGLGFYLFVVLGGLPMTADAQPGALEIWAAHVSMHGWFGHHVPHVPDTVAVNDQTLLHGAALYQANCAVCHGGANYAPSQLRDGVYPGVPQFVHLNEGGEHHGGHHEHSGPDDHGFYVIKHGIRFTGMPAWKYSMSDDDIWSVVNFMHNMDHLPPAVQAAWQKMPMSPIAPQPAVAAPASASPAASSSGMSK